MVSGVITCRCTYVPTGKYLDSETTTRWSGLHVQGGLSCVEIARQEGVSSSTVHGVLKRLGTYVYRRTKSPACAFSVSRPEASTKERNKTYALRKYGLTIASLRALELSQEGRCAICRRLPAEVPGHRENSLHVDHDHSTGQVRGLLCHHCNTALGKLQDSPSLLRAAANYLEASRGPSS